MKKIFLPLIIGLLVLSSCSKWLDVKPEDKFVEEEVFKSAQGFIDALNGIYIKLGASNMYGAELTMLTPDMLAKYYNISTAQSELRKALESYNYTDGGIASKLDEIWTNYYKNIINVNKFIEALDTYGGQVLDGQSLKLMRGEALALRAFLYFDVTRFFAPAFTVDPQAKRIPYYSTPSYVVSNYQSTTDVIAKILEDLTAAEALLKEADPAIEMSKLDQSGDIVDLSIKPYLFFRNLHLNYYAVKGLQARVYLYSAQNEKALAAAKEVISAKSKFPWTPITGTAANNKNINKVYTDELLFAFDNPKLTTVYDVNFNASISESEILASGTTTTFLQTVYDGWSNDTRYGLQWQPGEGKVYPTFLKYSNTGGKSSNIVPGMRISEMFLIAAELESDPSQALAYLNELRTNRNCDVVLESSQWNDKIMREYRREFYGEGQLWFYYKRTQAGTILSATAGGTLVSMAPSVYTFPIPLSETEPR